MSHTYSIACTQCKVHLWVAQGWPDSEPGQEALYSGEPKTMECLKIFLFKHRGHPLIFDKNHDTKIEFFSTEEEVLYKQKIMELVRKYNLGFMHNPGGGEFRNDMGLRIQVPVYDNKEDYEYLMKGLIEAGLEKSS